IVAASPNALAPAGAVAAITLYELWPSLIRHATLTAPSEPTATDAPDAPGPPPGTSSCDAAELPDRTTATCTTPSAAQPTASVPSAPTAASNPALFELSGPSGISGPKTFRALPATMTGLMPSELTTSDRPSGETNAWADAPAGSVPGGTTCTGDDQG